MYTLNFEENTNSSFEKYSKMSNYDVFELKMSRLESILEKKQREMLVIFDYRNPSVEQSRLEGEIEGIRLAINIMSPLGIKLK